MRYGKLGILALLTIVSGCETLNLGGKKVILPETPPISVDQLKGSVSTCRKDIDNLLNKRSHVPGARHNEFDQIVDMADDNCRGLIDALEKMRAATYYNQALKQNVQHAESIIVPGARVVEEPKNSFFSNFGSNDKADIQPAQSSIDDLVPLNDTPISSEPLE